MFQLGARVVFGLYRRIVSPAIHVLAGPGMGCRYEPSCSVYFEQAIREWGFIRGLSLGIRRILRCQPWGSSGIDPVPTKTNKGLFE